MTRFAERDEYKVGSLVGGFPVCTFSPKPYSRVITNIVVTNSVTSEVACYRGQIGGVAVARNLLGASNTIRGTIKIPAGQPFFVRWSATGASVRDATARVSWERDDNPLEAGYNAGQDWDENAITSLMVPNAALPNEAAIIVGSDLPPCMQGIYSSAVFWRPAGSLAVSGSAPLMFRAQQLISGGPGVQVVDEGFVVNDGVTCGFIVFRRMRATYDGTNMKYLENVGLISVVNMGFATTDPFSNPAIFYTSTDINTTGKLVLNNNSLQSEIDCREYDDEIDFPNTGSVVYVAIGNVCGVVFTAPDLGAVRILYNSELHVSAAGNLGLGTIEVREGNVIGAGAVVLAASDNNQLLRNDDIRELCSAAHMVVTGLTAGSQYNVQLMFRTNAGTVFAGRRAISTEAWTP